MKTIVLKTIVVGTFLMFLLVSSFLEPNYSFWLTLAVFYLVWIKLTETR